MTPDLTLAARALFPLSAPEQIIASIDVMTDYARQELLRVVDAIETARAEQRLQIRSQPGAVCVHNFDGPEPRGLCEFCLAALLRSMGR